MQNCIHYFRWTAVLIDVMKPFLGNVTVINNVCDVISINLWCFMFKSAPVMQLELLVMFSIYDGVMFSKLTHFQFIWRVWVAIELLFKKMMRTQKSRDSCLCLPFLLANHLWCSVPTPHPPPPPPPPSTGVYSEFAIALKTSSNLLPAQSLSRRFTECKTCTI